MHSAFYVNIYIILAHISPSVLELCRYADLILSVLAPKGAILMHTFEYKQEERPAVPYSISGQILHDLLGKACASS